jgi:hypothetical protein
MASAGCKAMPSKQQKTKLRFFLSGFDIGGNGGNLINDVFGKFGVVVESMF